MDYNQIYKRIEYYNFRLLNIYESNLLHVYVEFYKVSE